MVGSWQYKVFVGLRALAFIAAVVCLFIDFRIASVVAALAAVAEPLLFPKKYQ